MIKNPIMRTKLHQIEEFPCGDLFEEINENSMTMDAVNGGGWVSTILQGTVGCLASYALGNQGKICTWSVECQNNC
ncbi:plantaricin C family lantibiotic [Clostridium estertheticum]|uniref:plantaricin C family lantibiotic n=1 Tax=Clostridium estertheticum TaxID=238834 RepID=UPI001CF3AE25|nr:plantaricin C family lantibiotic [Clostridium estertheticum]MCB2356540.1 plantaricin C family lantibiotic [Clostridium estertheticum]WAG43625.1 plantaricin C family lantibiotic [Clostridium estertheticum]